MVAVSAVGWLVVAIGFAGYVALIWRLLGDVDACLAEDQPAAVDGYLIGSWPDLAGEAEATEAFLDYAKTIIG